MFNEYKRSGQTRLKISLLKLDLITSQLNLGIELGSVQAGNFNSHLNLNLSKKKKLPSPEA